MTPEQREVVEEVENVLASGDAGLEGGHAGALLGVIDEMDETIEEHHKDFCAIDRLIRENMLGSPLSGSVPIRDLRQIVRPC